MNPKLCHALTTLPKTGGISGATWARLEAPVLWYPGCLLPQGLQLALYLSQLTQWAGLFPSWSLSNQSHTSQDSRLVSAKYYSSIYTRLCQSTHLRCAHCLVKKKKNATVDICLLRSSALV